MLDFVFLKFSVEYSTLISGMGDQCAASKKDLFEVFQSLHCKISDIVLLAKPSQQLLSMVVGSHMDPWLLGWPHGQQEIFKNFQATTATNRFNIILLSLPHCIQQTRIRDENRDFRKSGKPLMKTGWGMPAMM